MKINNYSGAVENYQKAVKIKPSYHEAYNNYLFNLNYNNHSYIQNVLSSCLIMCMLNIDISNQRNLFIDK